MATNVFRVTTTGIMYGQQCQNVLHFRGPSSDPAQMSALADDVQTNWITNLRPRISGDLTWNSIQVRLLESQFATFTKTISIQGNAGTSNQLWTVQSFIIRLRSAVIGRHGHGRVYIAGVLPGQMQLGFWQSSTVTLWAGTLASILAAYGPSGSSTFRLGIGPKTNTTANFLDVVNLQLGPIPGTQKRRNSGVGI